MLLKIKVPQINILSNNYINNKINKLYFFKYLIVLYLNLEYKYNNIKNKFINIYYLITITIRLQPFFYHKNNILITLKNKRIEGGILKC
jgi:hypothetical protein